MSSTSFLLQPFSPKGRALQSSYQSFEEGEVFHTPQLSRKTLKSKQVEKIWHINNWKRNAFVAIIGVVCLILGIGIGNVWVTRSEFGNSKGNDAILPSTISVACEDTNTVIDEAFEMGKPRSEWFLNKPDPQKLLTTPPRAKSYDELPPAWDWRNYNGTGISLTTGIGNQMQPRGCGACWAFATTRALSDRIKIARYRKTGVVPSDIILSPQPLLDCGMRTFGSCYGGDPRFANKWIAENGIVDVTCSPYVAAVPSLFTSVPCADAQCHDCDVHGNCFIVKNPKKWFVAEYGTFNAHDTSDIVLDIMSEVYYRGPVVVSLNSRSIEYKNYKGGYILRDSTIYSGTTHDASIVGWGEENGVKFWVLRNSYGTNWGDEGFFRIERGINMYNIELQGVWAVPQIDE